MNSFSIRRKFLILGIIGIASLLFLAILSLNINQKGFKDLQNVFLDFKKVQSLQTTFLEPLFMLRESTLMLVMSPNINYKNEADLKILPLMSKLDSAFEKENLDLKQRWQEYKSILETTRVFALEGFDEGSFMNAISTERDAFFKLIDTLKITQFKSLRASEETFGKAERNVVQSKYYLIIGFLFIAFISFFFDSLIIKQIIISIEKVQKGLDRFFEYLKNPYSKDKKTLIELESNDELGKMAKAINLQVSKIQLALEQDRKLIQEATQTVTYLKEGKFGKRLQLSASSAELNALKKVMNTTISSLERKIEQEIHRSTSQEKLLVQQSKLASMGSMLGNIAHQWRQPLSEINAILMEAEAVTRYGELSKEDLLKHIKACYDITNHMSNTISDFQNFFQPSKEKEPFSIAEACTNAISIISASLKFHLINLNYDINKDIKINGYPNEFAHALLNIITNAKDTLVSRKIEDPTISISIKSGKKYTLIRIEDNAGGIDPRNIDRIFEPYFTTKHAKQGTGIGLYMTKVIIENNMQGFVSVKNIEKGARFTIKIR
ncbi:MAG: HAMP domain-containing sensor histidine kinase [Campylobacterales bacterium]|nr:HAMP domain-containing sensor histidine kinase [Campylobacterales bacterium]